jgi:transcriptional regulator with XRE-family HTH domain
MVAIRFGGWKGGLVTHRLERALGNRIRAVRLDLGLTLRDVERLSGGMLSSVAVGSYERADRTMSVTKFLALADFYGVAATDLLPSPDGADHQGVRPMTIDLARVAGMPAYRRGPLMQAAQQSGSATSDSFLLDAVAVRSLARVYGVEPRELESLFDSWGIVLHSAPSRAASQRGRPRMARHVDHASGGASSGLLRTPAVAFQLIDEDGAI